MAREIETLPEWEQMSFARWIARTVEKYFEDPDVQKRFKKWQEEQALIAKSKEV